MKGRPARAVAYLRVSTDKQAESGLGLEAQRVAVTAAADRLRLALVDVLEDAGVSGTLAAIDRPVLLQAIALLRRGDVLLVAKRDRIGRDVIEVAVIERMIRQRGGRVVSAAGEGTDNDDPSGLLMRRMMDSFAEYERALIAARTKAALATKRARGERISRFAPFGYRFDASGVVQPEAIEQSALLVIRESRARGLSMPAIAAELNRLGHRTRAGSAWRFEYVRNLLGGGAAHV